MGVSAREGGSSHRAARGAACRDQHAGAAGSPLVEEATEVKKHGGEIRALIVCNTNCCYLLQKICKTFNGHVTLSCMAAPSSVKSVTVQHMKVALKKFVYF